MKVYGNSSRWVSYIDSITFSTWFYLFRARIPFANWQNFGRFDSSFDVLDFQGPALRTFLTKRGRRMKKTSKPFKFDSLEVVLVDL